MRNAFFTAALLLGSVAVSGSASAAPKTELDSLFDQLAKADSPEDAKPVETKIAGLFHQSGSATVDLLMSRVDAALGAQDNKTAEKILASVTTIAPNYAEAWHARAGMEAAGNNDTAAMVSLQKVVALNPRQFEAMAELAGMLEDYGDKAGALKLYRRALALDPQLEGAARKVKALTRDVEGQDI